MKLIGRQKEIDELNRLFESDRSEFLAVYGRRRVGKTFLINKVFASKFSFKHTALSIINDEGKTISNKDQLNHFKESLKKYGYLGERKINDWFQAFYALEELLEQNKNERQVVFIDELPWLDIKGSKFINAFEAFWNGWGNSANILLIICGSSNSWMIKKVLNNYGGLYNRVTKEIEVLPFNLKESEDFFKEKNIVLSRYDIVQTQMIFGGIPYYLDLIDGRYSVFKNVDNLFFSKGATLKYEFDKLFKSTFATPHLVMDIVRFLYTKSKGYTRKEISEHLKISEGETLSNALNALDSCGIVLKYRPIIDNKKNLYYKLVDLFCLFFLTFVDKKVSFDEDIFIHSVDSMEIASWRGLAFENLCFYNNDLIKQALGISVIKTEIYPFIYVNETGKIESQIDMVIERKDNIVNLCEMKFYIDEYTLNKDECFKLIRKGKTLTKFLNKRQVIHNTLITTFGVKKNGYSSSFQDIITLDDLFL